MELTIEKYSVKHAVINAIIFEKKLDVYSSENQYVDKVPTIYYQFDKQHIKLFFDRIQDRKNVIEKYSDIKIDILYQKELNELYDIFKKEYDDLLGGGDYKKILLEVLFNDNYDYKIETEISGELKDVPVITMDTFFKIMEKIKFI